MIGPTRALGVFAYTEPCDMRKSFNTLTAIVEEQMRHSELAGDVFLFVSSYRKRAKVLYFDGTGLCVLAKRLGKGHIAPIWKRKRARGAEMTMSELSLSWSPTHEVTAPPTCCAPMSTAAIEYVACAELTPPTQAKKLRVITGEFFKAFAWLSNS